ncbi:DUF1150 family protein [Cognatishimia sp. SS12]|uniref:DUF1150 family protein n=1 Tax=Cognatishimia sp. SS12 TaxID=2979465 RepID=UPI00233019CF|nr:DUF1150 family protein [Cognatishimia sp. SS12]MDC0738253.1 DUF1150 family protein [Cognatishimia sp. SS12]
MHSKYDFDHAMDDRMVYVREVPVADLPADMQEEAEGLDTLFAVYSATDGERLALVKERRLAYVLARQNDYAPVSVH